MAQSISLVNGHTESVSALALSNRNNILASGGDDDHVYIWAVSQSTSPVLRLPRVGPCSALRFSSEKPDVLYSAHNRQILSWDTRNIQQSLSHWDVGDDEINSIDLLDNEIRLAAADDSGAVKLVATDSGRVVRTLRKHDNICSSVRFRPNRTWQVITGGLDCRMIVSDWKGTGLGVMIFEMDEIVDGCCSHLPLLSEGHQYHAHQRTTSSELDVSTASDEDTEYESDDDSDDGYYERYEGRFDPSTSPTTFQEYVDRVSLHDGSNHSTSYTRISVSDSFNPQAEAVHLTDRPEDEDSENLNAAEEPFPAEPSPVDSEHFSPDSATLNGTAVASSVNAWNSGLPVNPPMVHAIACTVSGNFVAAGLESATIELFSADGKRLSHVDSLYGHSRGVSALHCVEDSHLLSGGNDRNVFIWRLDPDVTGYQLPHREKISAIEGHQLSQIYLADHTTVIQVIDVSIC